LTDLHANGNTFGCVDGVRVVRSACVTSGWTAQIGLLNGKLVSVREVIDSDAPTLFELLTDPTVAAEMSTPPQSVAAFGGFIRWARDERASGRSVALGIVPRGLGQAIGIIQVRALEPSWSVAEWGFAIGAAFWGTGVFHEAANLVAGFAFDCMGVYRLEARAVVSNARGNGALQKLGARVEGTLARAFRRGARRDPQLMWGLNADDWRQQMLLRPRFSLDAASMQIAAALRDIEPRVRRQRPAEPTEPHPFFAGGSDGGGG
jgi:RimJ/RimL family protein N-acetyltransferase